MNQSTLLPYLQKTFDESLRLSEGSRKEARRAYEYLEGNQLPDDVKHILAERGQPERWENIFEEMDSSIEGMKLMTKQEINVHERNADDAERASIVTKLLRTALDSTEWWANKNRSDMDLRIVGFTAVESVAVALNEFDSKGKQLFELKHTHLPALECFLDMYARRPDFSDMRYFHHSRLMFKESLVKLFGKKAETLTADKSDMTRVTRTWYMNEKGERRIAIWASDIILEDKAMPYERLNRFNVAVRKLKYTQKKEFISMYKSVFPFQDQVNNIMLRLINMLGSTKMLVEASAVDDIDVFQAEYSLDNSVTKVNDGTLKEGRFKEISTSTDIAQLMQLVQSERAKAFKVMGINPELLGSSTSRQSGVALEIKQNAGLVGLQKFMTVSTELDRDTAEISTKIMEQYFTAEQVFSITDIQGKRESFLINAYKRDEQGRMLYEDGQPKQKNILSTSRYDFVLTSVPFNRGGANEKMKSWAEVMKILTPDVAQALVPSMLRDTGSSEAKEAQRVMDELAANASEQPSEPSQIEQFQLQAMMLDLEKKQAEIQEMMSKANLNNAKAEKP